MNSKHVAWVVLVVWLGWVGTSLSEEVEVIVDSANIKVRSDVIASARKGDRLTLIRREGPWMAVAVKTHEGERRGWVLITQVRPVVPPGIDEESVAPADPKLVDVAVNAAQCVFGNPSVIYFYLELTIANEGPTAILLDPGNLKLAVDGRELRPLLTVGESHGPMYMPVQVPTSDGRLTQSMPQQLKRLQKRELAARDKASGWVGFEVPQSILAHMPSAMESKPKSWVLSMPLGEEMMQLNLTETELKIVDGKIRPSSLDPSVQVLVVGPRINAVNGAKVIAALDSLSAKRQPYVVVCTGKGCLIDAIAREWIRNVIMRSRGQPSGPIWVNFAQEGSPQRMPSLFPFGPGGSMPTAKSEEAAVLEILARRLDAESVLIKHLANRSAEIRAVAARGLGTHVGRPGVTEALAKAAADEDAQVRTAAVYSLGGSSWAPPTGVRAIGMPATMTPQGPLPRSPGLPPPPPRASAGLEGALLELVLKATADPAPSVRLAAVSVLARSNDPRATQAVIKALHESDASVRTSAARSAGSHPVDAVVQPLIDVLDDKETAVTLAACESLGRLKAQAAEQRLKQLQASKNQTLAIAAINALKAIGALSEPDAALAKLDVGQLEPNEFDVLAKAKDRRCVPKLIDLVQNSRDSYQAGLAARVLGELGEKSAVEPLINALIYTEYSSEELPRALGKLGDKRAIEPLQKVMARPGSTGSRRTALLEGLLMLEAPEALKQVAEEIRRNPNSYDAAQMIQVLGRSRKNWAIPILAPLLDEQNACQSAAQALAEIGTPEATAALKERLSASDYQHSEMVVSSLVHRPSQPSGFLGEEARQQQARQTAELMRELAKSANPATRSVAMRQLGFLEEQLAANEQREFQRLVAERQLDAADKAIKSVFDRQLAILDKDPSQLARLNAHVNRMLGTYGAQESKRAERHLLNIIAALEAKAKQYDDEALKETLCGLRARRITAMLQTKAKVDAKDVRQTLAEIAARIKAKTEMQGSPSEMDTGMMLARTLEFNEQWGLAAEAYRMLAETIGSGAGEPGSAMKESLEGAARRLGLMGNVMELKGASLDGRPFDWASYRGKVVLVDFWATWCGPCRAELPNVKKHYQRYHERGFDVVGISLDRERQALEQFVESEKLPWVTLHEKESAGRHPLAVYYGIIAIPTVLLVDKQGTVVSLRARGQELDRLLQEQIGPPYQPKGNLLCVDIAAKANRKRAEMFAGFPNNNLEGLPGGEQTLGGVKFKVGDAVIQLAGQKLTDAPVKVEGIVVGSSVERLYFLHATQFGDPTHGVLPGTTIGEYKVRFEDGASESIPIVVGEDVGEWWHSDGSSATSRGIVVWTGASDASKAANMRLRLFLSAWDNPHPGKKVATIDVASANTPAAPFCLAITAEERSTGP